MAETKSASPVVRMLIDYGPLSIFFGVNALARGALTAEHTARLETAVERIQRAREVLAA